MFFVYDDYFGALSATGLKRISQNITTGTHNSIWKSVIGNEQQKIREYIEQLDDYLITMFGRFCVTPFICQSKRDFVIKNICLIPLIKLDDGFYLKLIRRITILHIYVSSSKVLLALLSNPDRYNFFLQFHKMLDSVYINLKESQIHKDTTKIKRSNESIESFSVSGSNTAPTFKSE